MTIAEMMESLNTFILQCPVKPTTEELQARGNLLWEEVQKLQQTDLERALMYVAKQPEFKFFPSVGQILDAIEQTREKKTPSNLTHEEYRLLNDPEYRRLQREESERAAKEYFASQEFVTFVKRHGFKRLSVASGGKKSSGGSSNT